MLSRPKMMILTRPSALWHIVMQYMFTVTGTYAVVVVLAIVAVSFVGLAVCLAIICCGVFCLRRSVDYVQQ